MDPDTQRPLFDYAGVHPLHEADAHADDEESGLCSVFEKLKTEERR